MQKNLLNPLLIILLFLAGIYLLKSQTRCQWKEPTPNPNRPIVTRELNCDNADSRVSLNGSVERQNSREVLGQKHKQNVGAEENISTVNSQYPLSYLYHPPTLPTRPPFLVQIHSVHELTFVPHISQIPIFIHTHLNAERWMTIMVLSPLLSLVKND